MDMSNEEFRNRPHRRHRRAIHRRHRRPIHRNWIRPVYLNNWWPWNREIHTVRVVEPTTSLKTKEPEKISNNFIYVFLIIVLVALVVILATRK